MQQYWYILGISVHNFTQLGERADFLRPFIWSCILPDAISRWFRQRNSIKVCAYLAKSAIEILPMIRQVFRKEIMSRARKVRTHEIEKGKTGEEQSEENAQHFLLHQGDCSQRIVLTG
jgi:hypothetical protein